MTKFVTFWVIFNKIKYKVNFSVLRNCGQTSLAYLAAATHGYSAEAEELKAELESRQQPIPPVDPNARLLVPPPPVARLEENWPLLASARGTFDAQLLGLGGQSAPTNVGGVKPAAAAFAVMDDDVSLLISELSEL